MKSTFGLLFAGLLLASTPGCCVLDHQFGCGQQYPGDCQSAQGHDSCGSSKKCSKKCKKCRECLAEEGMAGGFYPGMMYADGGFGGDSGCGCEGGGGMMAGYPDAGGGGGCASCAQGGSTFQGGGGYESHMVTPPMTIPTPSPTYAPTPMPPGGTPLPPPIPPAEIGALQQVPAGTQQVSVEEFQRLPGVVISGPGAQTAAVPAPAVGQPMMTSSPAPIAAPQVVGRPVAAPPVYTSAPANARQVQQTGWAPVRR